MSMKTTHFEMVITSPVTQSSGANSKDISKKEREVDDIVHSKKISSPTSLKHRIIWICTILQRTSAPFISIFATVHLTAPIAANFGGSQLSTSTMLLGREYYQGPLTEPLLLFVPLGIHISSSILRRILLGLPKRPTLLQATAYTALLSLPIHIAIHRILPSTPTPPISALSPSEINYEFVKAGFTYWPALSWVAYGGLVGVVLLHAGEGASVLVRSLTGKRLSKKWRRGVAAGVWSAVMGGLYWISKEPLQLRGNQLDRVMAVYGASRIHRGVDA